MTLKELQEKREKLVHDAREALDEIKSNTDDARAAELDDRHDKIMAEFDKVDKQMAREQRQAEIERQAEEARAKNRPTQPDGEARGQEDGVTTEYREVFYKMLSKGGDVGDLSSEERDVLRAGVPKDAESRIQNTTGGSGSAGGYTVPVELSNQIIKSMLAWGPMYDPGVTTEMVTSSGHQINIPTVNDTTVTAEKHSEGTAITDDGGKDVTFGQKSLNAFAYDTEFVRWSWELAQDSIFNMETLLGSLLGERLGRIANLALTTGDGDGDPNGIVTASSQGKEAAAEAAVTTEELLDLVHSVDPAYRTAPRVRWMMNDSTLATVRKLKDGDGNYLWQMGNIQQGVPGAIWGYGYSVNQAMPNMATGTKPIIFGDFGKYFVRKVGSPVIGVMRERFWPDLGIAGLIRFDGELGDTAAVKHLVMDAGT